MERAVQPLVRAAKEAMSHAYNPYSRFAVGAALRTLDGRVYTGCNIENASFGATCCAERVALYKAVSEGVRGFEAIAIISQSSGYTMPCGVCRQVLSEFAPSLVVYTANVKGDYVQHMLEELLPHAFNQDMLNKPNG